MKCPKFNNLSIWEKLGVIGSIASIIGIVFYFADKLDTKTDSGYQKPAVSTEIKIGGNVNNSNIAGHDLNIQQGVSPETINQIVTTLTKNHQLDVQVKDEQIKALTEAITALTKGQGIDATQAERDAAFSALKQGNTAIAKSLFANTAEKYEKQSKQLTDGAEQKSKQAAESLRYMGALAFLDNTQEALQAFRRATQLDPDNADGWNYFGVLLARVGRINEAIAAFNTVFALGDKHGNKLDMSFAYGNLGLIYNMLGDLDKSIEFHQKALRLHKDLGNKEGMAGQYGNLGNIYSIRGDLDKAIEFQQKSLVINEELGNLKGMASDYGNLGIIHQMRGALDKATEFHQRALKLDEDLGIKEGMAINYGNLGIVYQTLGNLNKAIEYQQKALKLDEELRNKEGMSSNYGNLGVAYQMRGDLDKAIEYHQEALNLNEELGRKPAIPGLNFVIY